MPVPALSKHTAVGIALQTAYNTPNVAGIQWAAIDAEMNFQEQLNFAVLDQGDMSDWEYDAWTPGTHYQGNIPFSAIPSMMSTYAAWCLERDSYNQPTYATIAFYDDKRGGPIAVQDCVVSQVTWTFNKRAAVTQAITAFGRKEASSAPSIPTPADVVRGMPYVCKEITVQVDFGSGYVTVADFESLTIVVDTLAENPDEGFRLESSGHPHTMYTLGGIRVSGNMTRDYVDDSFREIISAMRDGAVGDFSSRIAIKVTATRGASSCTWEMPYVQFMNWEAPFPGNSTSRRQEAIEYRAFTGADGTEAPLTITA